MYVWRSENCFLTPPSRQIRRSDIEWRWLRRLIRQHVVIVKKVWEFAVDLEETNTNGDCALAGRRTLTAAKNKSVLRGGSESMKFPMLVRGLAI